MFLTHEDFKPFIQDSILAQVQQQNPEILQTAELMALAEMSSYLNTRFDTTAIFAQTGNNRHQAVVMYLTDITLYHIHARLAPRNISEIRAERYHTAIEWLKMAANGTIQPDLPEKKNTDGSPDNRIKFGSNQKPELRY